MKSPEKGMTMSKKHAPLLLVAVAAAMGLAACGPTVSESGTSGTDPATSTSEVTNYSVTIGETAGAVLAPSATSAAPGTRITITVTSLPEGKEIETVSVDVPDVGVTENPDGTYYFLMPASNVTVSCTLKDAVRDTYGLTIINNGGGEVVFVMTADASAYEYKADENGIYHLPPEASYLLRYIGAPGPVQMTLNGTPLTVGEEYTSFTMPAANSVIQIDPVEAYALTLSYDTAAFDEAPMLLGVNASGEAYQINASAITPGTDLVLSAYPKYGYTITAVTLDETPVAAGDFGYTFEMPDHNATLAIKTEYTLAESHLLKLEEDIGLDITLYEKTETGTYEEAPSVAADNRFYEAGTDLAVKVRVLPSYASQTKLKEVLVNEAPVTADAEGYYAFKMGNSETAVHAVAEAIITTLSFDAEGSGATAVFKDDTGAEINSIAAGSNVNVTFTHPDGLEVEEVLVNGSTAYGDLIGNTFSITARGEEMVFTVTWKSAVTEETYAISYEILPEAAALAVNKPMIQNASGDSVTEAAAGEKIYVRAFPDPDMIYSLSDILLDGVSIKNQVEERDYLEWNYFVMPEKAVKLVFQYTAPEDVYYDIALDQTGVPDGAEYYLANADGMQLPLTEYRGKAGDVFQVLAWAPGVTSKVYVNGEPATDLGGSMFEFTMPAEDVLVTVTWGGGEVPPAASYSLTYQPSSADPAGLEVTIMTMNGDPLTSAKEGDMVFVNVWCEGHTPASVWANDEQCSIMYGSTYYFYMPAEDVVITIEWDTAASTGHSVTFQATEGQDNLDVMFTDDLMSGNMQYSLSGVEAGTKVYLNVWDLELSKAPTVKDVIVNGEIVTWADPDIPSFTMPDADVVVTITLAL